MVHRDERVRCANVSTPGVARIANFESRRGQRNFGHSHSGDGVEWTNGERPRGVERVRRPEAARRSFKRRGFVDQDVRCDHVPSTYAGARCFGLERCVDPIYRAPSMKCVFQTLLDATRTKHVGYINGDIIIFRDFLDTLAAIERDHDRFFMVGRRETRSRRRKKKFLTYAESASGASWNRKRANLR